MMVIAAAKLCRPLHCFYRSFVSTNSVSPTQLLEESIKAAVEAKNYHHIPDLLNGFKGTSNPFSFLSTSSLHHRNQIVDEILQSFIPLRPRSRPRFAYSYLLSHTLQNPNPLPLALAILQQTLRSGCAPVPQTHLLLSSVWLDYRKNSHTVPRLLLEMQSIGYHPDCGTCNYLISSLCKIDQFKEAIQVLRDMGRAGCLPDLDSYGSVIGPLCVLRRNGDVVELLKEMIAKCGLTPRQEMVIKVLAAMRASKDIWKAVELIEFFESMGIHISFESYELVVEGCLESGEFVLAGKVVVGMTNRGFIPYIRVRQKVFEGLANAGEWELACTVRGRFLELQS